ncbi:hypothetical protein PanWU01x14_177590 [Parasponia andersonii]|uniref:Uncharacterized protein n=1 Tax=Parasponia andersonii TaxID=3476 RepID=A0A2P5C7K9_PARAD|nr:hypothetical protein PanWU01x14_177590 [Parasponia andersonii]
MKGPILSGLVKQTEVKMRPEGSKIANSRRLKLNYERVDDNSPFSSYVVFKLRYARILPSTSSIPPWSSLC